MPSIAIIRRITCLLLTIPAIFITSSDTAAAQSTLPSTMQAGADVRMVKSLSGKALLEANASSAIESFTATERYLFFMVAPATIESEQLEVESGAGWELWRTDGTEAGTQRAINLSGFQRSDLPHQAGRRWLYLFAQQEDRVYLFRTDGDTTTQLGAIPAGQRILAQAVGGDDTLYYVTGEAAAPASGVTLWRVQPDAPTPLQLWQSGALADSTSTVFLQATPNFIYLVAQLAGQAPAIYSAMHSDVTLEPLITLDGWPSAVSSSADRFYFFVSGDESNQLWRSSGTLTETVPLLTTPPITATQTRLLTFADDSGQDQIYFTYYFPEQFSPYSFAFSELWRSDGTPATTRMVKRIDFYAHMDEFMHDESKIYFWMTRYPFDHLSRPNAQLYVSDGTPEGTDILHPDLFFQPSYTIIGNKHFFTPRSHGPDREVHIYDSAAGAYEYHIVSDINFGFGAGIVNQGDWGAFHGILYFPATDGIDGAELWRSDGTPSGTWQVKNIHTQPIPPPVFLPPYRDVSFAPTELTAGDDYLYFVADEGRNGPHVYRTDGTEAGTLVLPNRTLNNEWTAPRQLTTQGDTLYFLARYRYTPEEHWYGLWQSDGTADGTRLLVDNVPGYQASLTVTNNRLLLLEDQKMGVNWGLWRLNDSHDGLELLFNFNIWETGGADYSSIGFVSTPHQTFFQNYGLAGGGGLWRSDGTHEGTYRIPGYHAYALFAGSHLVYGKWLGSDGSYHYWRSDGTTDGTFEVKAFAPPPQGNSSFIARDSVAGDRLYVAHAQSGQPIDLWGSDGTVGGTQLLATLFGTADFSQAPTGMAADGDRLYLMDHNNFGGGLPPSITIWQSDGTDESTFPLLIGFGHWSERATAMMAHNGQIFFTIFDTGAVLLYRTDGTALGTQFVATLAADIGDSTLSRVAHAKVGSTLYFNAYDEVNGDELWAAETSGQLGIELLYLPSVARP
ncbi:MAG: hypothetical protein IT328_01270 [Caldilineaceae bacterium]|nr:hypothetical protein [Caldilineaceae bacterium]